MNKKHREHIGRLSTECSSELWKGRKSVAAMTPTEQRREVKLIIQRHMTALVNLTQEQSGNTPAQGEH